MGGAFEVAFERVEAEGKLRTVWLEPFVEFTKWFDAQAIEPALSIAANLDEAGVAQHLEVPGHTGLGHADCVHEFRHRALAAPHDVEEPTAGRFGDHVEDGKLTGHALNIRHHIYMCNCIFPGACSPLPHRQPLGAIGPAFGDSASVGVWINRRKPLAMKATTTDAAWRSEILSTPVVDRGRARPCNGRGMTPPPGAERSVLVTCEGCGPRRRRSTRLEDL